MRCPIRPGKVTCAGIVAILMILPNSIWKGPDAQEPVARTKIQKVEKSSPSSRADAKVKDAAR